MKAILLLSLTLTGCKMYGGGSVHDRAFDSEYTQSAMIVHLGFAQEITENTEVFYEHNSMPGYRETNNVVDPGYGVNEIGLRGYIKLW